VNVGRQRNKEINKKGMRREKGEKQIMEIKKQRSKKIKQGRDRKQRRREKNINGRKK
jgi:hypothetical protein